VPKFEVYDHYLRGNQALLRGSDADFRLAVASFQKAVELDPDYADAWSALAMAESFVGESESDDALDRQAQLRALAASKRAIELDPLSGDAVAAHGYMLNQAEWNWSAALDDLRKSVILDPNDARNHLRHAHVLASINRLPEARAALEEATRVDPLFTPAWYWLGRVKAAEGDIEGARRAMNRVLAIDPDFRSAESYLSVLSLLQGDAAAAHADFSRHGRPLSIFMADFSLGNEASARKALNEFVAQPRPKNPYAIATAYAWMGDKDQAFQWLDQCVATRDGSRAVVAFDPLLRKLRPDPRYKALLRKFNLPEQ
jgi:tetratricopeptide (TPR) repeat protein